MTIINCKKCGKSFNYKVWGTGYPGGKDYETADYPYCGQTGCSEMTSQCISGYMVDDFQNQIYQV